MLSTILESLRSLPKRYVIAWMVWGIGAVMLVGTALILSGGDGLGVVFRNLPRWHQFIDIVWGSFGVLLVGLGLLAEQVRFRHKIEDRLDQLNAKVDLLLVTRPGGNTFATEYQLPPPLAEASLGWIGAVTDTLKAETLLAVDDTKVRKVFARVAETDALVNAAIGRLITIPRIRLDSPTQARPSTPHLISVDIVNNTAKALTLQIPKGQVFENATRRQRVQNLVVAKPLTLTCAPNSRSSVKIPAYCLNRNLEPPRDHPGNITPLKVKFEFSNQKDVWAAVKEHTA